MQSKITKQDLVRKISESKKYRDVYPKTIVRVVEACWGRYNDKDIEYKIKNQLHQIWGAYWTTRPNFVKLLDNFTNDIRSGISINEALLPILNIQFSTQERIPILNEFYQNIFKVTGYPNSIIEHACGLNPLTVFWMDLPENTKYSAFDIDIPEIYFLNEILKKTNYKNKLLIQLGDLLVDKFDYAEVVFMLKLLPCLDRQQKTSALDAMKQQKCKYLVVSYPIKSLIRLGKGMLEFYTKRFESLIKNENWTIQKILFETELVFIIKK